MNVQILSEPEVVSVYPEPLALYVLAARIITIPLPPAPPVAPSPAPPPPPPVFTVAFELVPPPP